MKYQFNKIFPPSIHGEDNADKPQFGHDLGLLVPILGDKFFLRF